jgi:hypothetical protein
MSVTKSLASNIIPSPGNTLSIFVDDSTGLLSIKDVNGCVQAVCDYISGGGGASVCNGTLKTFDGTALSGTLNCISDYCNNISPLKMSTNFVTNYGFR